MEANKIIITGGAARIGAAIAKNLSGPGVEIVIHYNNSINAANKLVLELGEDNVYAFKLSATDDKSTYELLNFINKNSGQIDVFISNAGITNDNHFVMMNKNEWNSVIDVNLNSVFTITKIVSKLMMQKKIGSIIFISSISGLIGQECQANYSASKAGLIAFSKSIAKELAKFNIRVNTVTPGFIETDMIKKIPKKTFLNYINNVPLRREGQPYEVANAVYFLSSEDASYITGTNLVIDGGLI